MCKSSALIFVLLFAFLFRLERFSLHLIGVITLITAGVFLMVFDTTSVNIPGIVMVFSASALSGLRWALTETLMKKKSMGLSNPFATIFWLAPLMAAVLIPVSLGVEGWSNVFGSGHFDKGSAIFTVLVILFPGAIAFAMVSTEYL
jgi:solute carrier family 35 protein C2